VPWDRPFAEPIELPGKKLITLRNAALYITNCPRPNMKRQNGRLRVFDTSRKDHHWGRRKLARTDKAGLFQLWRMDILNHITEVLDEVVDPLILFFDLLERAVQGLVTFIGKPKRWWRFFWKFAQAIGVSLDFMSA
jgi:hypothetical protein